MKPQVSDLLHYFDEDGSEPRAAIVTKVWSDTCVNLHVFSDGVREAADPTSVMRRDESNRGNVWEKLA